MTARTRPWLRPRAGRVRAASAPPRRPSLLQSSPSPLNHEYAPRAPPALPRRRRSDSRSVDRYGHLHELFDLLRSESDPDPGRPDHARNDLAGGTTLDGYTLTEVIGSGGMSTVWRARQSGLERDVAVKVLRKDLAEDENLKKRFRREGESAQAIWIIRTSVRPRWRRDRRAQLSGDAARRQELALVVA